MMSDKVRVLRLLEYYGERRAVEEHLNKRGVKGQSPLWHRGGVIIHEAMLGEFPITLKAGDLFDKESN